MIVFDEEVINDGKTKKEKPQEKPKRKAKETKAVGEDEAEHKVSGEQSV